MHFRSGVSGSPDLLVSSTGLVLQLDALLDEINQQSNTLESAVLQLDHLQQVSPSSVIYRTNDVLSMHFIHRPTNRQMKRNLMCRPVLALIGHPNPASPSGPGGPATADGFESGVFPAGSRQGRRRTKCK